MINIIYRRAVVDDYPDILVLHRQNLFSKLSDLERQDGFLSLDLSEQQIAAANEDLAVVVATQEKSLLGYVFGTTKEYNRQFPLLNHMISLYAETEFQRRPFSDYSSFLYGPVCVSTAYRGTGILQGLFRELQAQVVGEYDAGAAFVSKDNPRSRQAHVQKLGMEVLRDFEFKGKPYLMLGFTVSL